MQTRRPTPITPLAIVLPHPPLPRRTSSLLSVNSISSPRTPRSCGSPTCPPIFLTPIANRKSTDSWNSSNGPDDLESEWKPEQVLLLSRTLDALPAHLVTPFNGPIPPSNLLDKIARGVSQAKGPVDWPHSLRATRVKLIELSRLRAKEQANTQHRRKVIAEEPDNILDTDSNYSYFQNGEEKPVGIGLGAKRPLYRQSSMDFMNTVRTDIQNNEHLARLSSRLQRAERQTSHHPYNRAVRAMHYTSPPPSRDVPSLINPSTPSSSTLNTLSSFSSQPHVLRRTGSSVSSSSLSILSTSSDGILPNPRVQSLMRDDAFVSTPQPKDASTATKVGFKRAPSFSALAQESRREYLAHTPVEHGHARKNSGTCPSSDEEEKVRNKQAKKPRKYQPANDRATPPPESSAPSTPASSPIVTRRVTRTSSKINSGCPDATTMSPKASRVEREGRSECNEKGRDKKKENVQSLGKGSKVKHPTKSLPMNLQRNPSILGAELPYLKDSPLSLAPPISSRIGLTRSPSPSLMVPKLAPPLALAVEAPVRKPTSSSPVADVSPSPPSANRIKTLRRVRRLAPARRISFSSLVPPGEEADADGEGEGEEKGGRIELGSAFQLH